MKKVFDLAETQPFPPEAELYDTIETKRLVRFCREFQREAGDGPFFLSCRSAGDLFGLEYRTAARRLKAMCGDGLLEVVGGGDKEAFRYRYCGALDNA